MAAGEVFDMAVGEPGVLTLEEAAVVLRVHPKTVERECKRGRLPHVRIGSKIRISAAMLDRYLNGQWTPHAAKGGEQ